MFIINIARKSRVFYVISLSLLFTIHAKDHFNTIIKDLPTPDNYESEESYHAYLWKCYQYPIDLNYGSQKKLRKLGILTQVQLNGLVNYIKRYGLLCSIDELAAIPGWHEELIRKIKPFIKVRDTRKKRKKRGRGKALEQKITLEWTPKWEAKKEGDLGSADDIVLAYQLDYKKYLRLKFQVHKGVGEGWEQSYITGSCQVQPKGLCSKMIVGKYNIRLGQGLLIGNSSWEEDTFYHIKKRLSTLSLSRSQNRNSGLLGIALALHKSKSPWHCFLYMGLTPYYAYKKSEKGHFCFTTIPQGRMATSYRNLHAWENKRGVVELLGGVALLYQTENKSYIGIQVMGHEYRDYLQKWQNISQKIEKDKYASQHLYYGIMGYKKGKYGSVGGELLYTARSGIGLIAGAMAQLSGHCRGSIKLKYGSPHFYALHSSQKKSTKPYHYKSVGCSVSYVGTTRRLDNSLQIYEGKNLVKKKMIRGLNYTVNYTHTIPSYDLAYNIKSKWKLKKGEGLTASLSLKIPSYKMREEILSHTAFYLGGNKRSYTSPYNMGVGIGQVITYEKEAYSLKVSAVLFATQPKAGVYMYQPNLRFPYVKKYTGRGIGTTVVGRYKWSANCCIEAIWQWKLGKKGTNPMASNHFFVIRLIYTMTEYKQKK